MIELKDFNKKCGSNELSAADGPARIAKLCVVLLPLVKGEFRMKCVLPQYAHHPVEEIRAYDLDLAYRLDRRKKTGRILAGRVREAGIRGPGHGRIARIVPDTHMLTAQGRGGQARLHRRHALAGECDDLFQLQLIRSGTLNLPNE